MQTTPSTASSDAIATAAYYHWINAGRPAGRDQEFWLQAEAEIRTNGKPVAAAPISVIPKSASKNGAKARRRTG